MQCVLCRLVRYSVVETYENESAYDLAYGILVFITFLPTLILPFFYSRWILIGNQPVTICLNPLSLCYIQLTFQQKFIYSGRRLYQYNKDELYFLVLIVKQSFPNYKFKRSFLIDSLSCLQCVCVSSLISMKIEI